MTRRETPYDQAVLRSFLLGTLPEEEVAAVTRWVQDTPTAAEVVAGIDARDAVVEAIDRTGESEVELVPPTTVFADSPDDTAAELAEGGYRVIRELGRGGMGVVLEAEDTRLKRSVAIKVIAAGVAGHPTARDRLVREAQAVARIDHPNVVPILHIGGTADRPYLVMPVLKGETLEARLKRDGVLPVEEVLRVGREVAAGLAAAHAEGLVHRDVKPANIWLEADTGRVRLLDFGIVKPAAEHAPDPDLTRTGAVMGSAHYMAPEQADGKPVDARTDLFSLGAVLYHAAAGRRPFTGDTPYAVLSAVLTQTPPPVAAVPPRLGAVIRSLLEKDPAARPASAAAVIAGLQDAVPVARPSRPRRFTRRAVAAGFLAAAVLAAVVVIIIRDKNGKEVARIEVPKDGKYEVTGADAAADANRRAAGWALSIGGTVRVTAAGQSKLCSTAKDLPADPYRVTEIVLAHNDRVTDDGLANLKGLDGLKLLQLAYTPVTDAGLAHLAGLTTLENVRLERTKVSTAGLVYFKGWDKLEHLDLSFSRIDDSAVEAIVARKGLLGLGVAGTGVTTAGLRRLRELPNLTILVVGPKFGFDVAEQLKAIPRLTHLGLYRLSGKDADLAPLRMLDGLRELDLYQTQITNDELAHLKAMPGITWLRLSSTPVTDAGLAHLKAHPGLRDLVLSYTAVTDAGLDHLATLPGLRSIDVRQTQVTEAAVVKFQKAHPNCTVEFQPQK